MMPSVTDASADLASAASEGPASTRLFHRFSSSAQFLCCPPAAAPSPECRVAKRRKRPSRRHQRFLERKAFLQRQGILRQNRLKGKGGPPSPAPGPNASQPNCTVQAGDPKAPSNSDVNGNRSTLLDPSYPRPEAESDSLPLLATSADPSKRDPPAQRVKKPAREGPVGQSRAADPRRATKHVAIDCEMVGTGPCGRLGEMARCSIVNYQCDVVYDKYVKPRLPITDYRTRWSGIRKQHMTSAIEFNVAQREILKILKGKIVVGHALHNDFKALKYFHPKSQTRDTSKIPMLKRKAGFPERESVSLKNLAKRLLHKNIQVGRDGHCSVEDACTSMELYRLVEVQWEQKLHSWLSAEQEHAASETNSAIDRYMGDQYWPADLQEDSK
uniref:apoptosis-enhancing nuclease-like n=1 Tax=Pristiophorus japonicus TaxID=55135 RepID=UPI00398F5234